MALAVLWLGVAPAVSQAGFVLFTPNPNSKTEFMLFNGKANMDVTSFIATVGDKNGPAVTVSTVQAVDSGAGFANIKAAKGNSFTSVTFTPANSMLFNDFATNGQLDGPSGASQETFTLKVVDNFGASFMFTETIKADGNGAFPFDFAVIANQSGEFIKSVTFAAANGIKESKQTEFSLGNPVPEPATMALALTGLASLGLTYWRKGR
jgi:hypothetical protein